MNHGSNMRVTWLAVLMASLCLQGCGLHILTADDFKVSKGSGDQNKNSFDVTGRYACKDVSDGSTRGSCDMVTRTSTTCEAAVKEQQNIIATRGDICRRCQENQIDNTRIRDHSKPVEWIQGGPCFGVKGPDIGQ